MSEALFNERVVVCPKCEGDGKIELVAGRLIWNIPNVMVQSCWRCHGDGYVLQKEDAA